MSAFLPAVRETNVCPAPTVFHGPVWIPGAEEAEAADGGAEEVEAADGGAEEVEADVRLFKT